LTSAGIANSRRVGELAAGETDAIRPPSIAMSTAEPAGDPSVGRSTIPGSRSIMPWARR
jgi:hypothetical protein